MQSGDDTVHKPFGVELVSGPIPHTVAIHRLGLFDGVYEDRQSPHVIVRFRTACTGRQSVHDDACYTRTHEGGSGSYADSRAAGEQDILESQRPVVIVRQVRAGSRSTRGFKQLLTLILTVVDLNVGGKTSARGQ